MLYISASRRELLVRSMTNFHNSEGLQQETGGDPIPHIGRKKEKLGEPASHGK